MAYTGSNKRVLKNTIVLYVRMMVVMVVGLVSSRLLLKYLGVEDYGLYHVVGAVVSLLSYVNNVLTGSGTRFLTYSFGADDAKGVQRTFSTMLNVQFIMMAITLIILLMFGQYILDSKTNIPANRMDAVTFAFYCSVFTAVTHLFVVPYNSAIIAHERMTAFAWFSLIDVFSKLLIVYAIVVSPFDRLKTYALLLAFMQVVYGVAEIIYCRVQFKELRYVWQWDWKYMFEVYAFAGWSFIGAIATLLLNQGVTILNQRYFGAALVTAFTLSLTVWGQIKAFINNYRAAANPQIIKLFAAGKHEESRSLMVNTVLLSYFIYLVLAVPMFFFADVVLGVWLESVPEWTIGLVRIVMITGAATVFADCFYTAISARGRLKEYILSHLIVGGLTYATVWGLIRTTHNQYASAIVLMLNAIAMGFLVMPLLLKHVVGYEWLDFVKIFVPAVRVTLMSVVVGCFLWWSVPHNVVGMILGGGAMALLVCVICWYMGVPLPIREKLLVLVKSKLPRVGS